ncbi:MAG: hypothetical protein V1492_01735 [Candidatus Micrarchaeota archaeon]
MERKISFSFYVVAFLVAAALFSIGVYVGTTINNGAVTGISSEVSGLSSRLSMMQLLALMEENNSAFCPVYRSELAEIDTQREKLGYELTLLEEQKHVFAPETKKEYMMLQAQSYLLAKKTEQTCPGKNSVYVLYFYSNDNCDSCKLQGDDILRARDEAKNKDSVKIYAFDSGIGSPVVDAFKSQYQVKNYPTTIVNGIAYRSLTSKDVLRGAMENVTGN